MMWFMWVMEIPYPLHILEMWILSQGITLPSTRNLNFKDVHVVPDLKKNLLSVGKFASDNYCCFEFTSCGFIIKDHNQTIIARGHKERQLYTLKEGHQKALSAIRGGGSTYTVWHQRLGHQNSKFLSLLRNKINITHWVSKPTVCASCQMEKSCNLLFKLLIKFHNILLKKFIVIFGALHLWLLIIIFDIMHSL